MDYMWQHYCKVEKSLMGVENGKPCNWCGAKEEKSNTIAIFIKLFETNKAANNLLGLFLKL